MLQTAACSFRTSATLAAGLLCVEMRPFRFPPAGRGPLVAGAIFLLVLLTAHLFAASIFELLNSEAVVSLDGAVWEWCQAHSSLTLLAAMSLVSAVHGTIGILMLTAITAAGWYLAGHRGACVRLLMAVPTGMVLNALVKAAIHRTRPDWALVVLPSSASFPSGHVAEATVFYGLLALAAVKTGARAAVKSVLGVTSVVLVMLVASSRVILGVHYASDCVGAAFEGLLWVAACSYGRLATDTSPAGEA